jgi:SAM-dependent methyltransferase
LSDASSNGRPGVAGYVARFLRQENATLPRIMVRSAECALISRVQLARPILDIGSGDGTFAQALFDAPVDVGLDNSRPQMLRSQRLSVYRDLTQTSAEELPFRDGVFASVFSNSTLEHIPHPWLVLKEASRVLRPGGVCVITVPSQHFPRYLAGSQAMRTLRLEGGARAYERFFNRISRHLHIEPPEKWMDWVRDAGMQIEDWRYYYSRRDTMLFELAHYVSVPSMLTRAALGRWVLWPGKANYLPYRQVLAPFSSPGPSDEGAYIFIRASKP